jgi:hypothetical protein
MIGNLNSIFKQRNKPVSVAPAYDTDAQAYFTANTAITSDADKNAINTYLFVNAKSQGYYSKIKEMILPLWSTATNNKWNLVNPLDTNGAFRLTFSTGWTHSSSGMTPNGTSAFADTYLIPSTNLTQDNAHLSFYSGTNSVGNHFDIGASGSPTTGTNSIVLYSRFTGDVFAGRVNAQTNTQATNTNAQGFYITSRLVSNTQQIFKNGTKTSSSVNSTGRSANSINIGRWNNPSGTLYYSNKQCRFSSIGEGLTDTEATNFTNNVNALMTYFGLNTF